MRLHKTLSTFVLVLALATPALAQNGLPVERTPVERAPVERAPSSDRPIPVISESFITTQVKSHLAADPLVHARQITVVTKGTVVTLSGLVPTNQARTRAVLIATGVRGVTDVEDKLVVAP